MNLGETIHRLRVQHNMSQGDLADALDVSRQSVSKWENNNAVPDLDRLVKMADLFGITLDELVKGTASPTAAAQPNLPEEVKVSTTQKVLGIILLCFGGLLLLMTLQSTSLGAIIECLLLAAPLVGCGIICLKVKKRAWLYCLLLIYGYLWLPMGILAPSYINFNAARVAQGLHIFWGIWLMGEGLILKKNGKFFESRKAVTMYFLILAVTVFLSLLILLFPTLLPTPGLMHS